MSQESKDELGLATLSSALESIFRVIALTSGMGKLRAIVRRLLHKIELEYTRPLDKQ